MINRINIQSKIIEDSRHQFLYGENNNERQISLRKAVENYPIKFNEDMPTAIYIDEIGLPKVEFQINNLDEIRINRLGMNYLEFTIAYNIINRIMQGKHQLQIDCEKLINSMKIMMSESGKNKINTLEDFRDALRKSIDFYKQYYVEYSSTGETKLTINELEIPFLLDLELFIRRIQRITQNNSFFSIILDKQKEIALPSVKAINAFINSRCNSVLSIKVACEPEEWETYRDFSGMMIEDIHDYSKVELDHSFRQYIQRIKESYNLEFDER